MSTTIDERVVEMRFDNKNFESNVAASISSLKKLKRSLDLNGAAKGLENLERSAKSVDMNPLGKSVDAIKSKFSALEMVATGALLRIGSSVAEVGMQFANAVTSMSSLNLENITAGWSKFNDKNSAVATLVAQGYSLEKVNEQLDRLNWYTDETSYNFIDMVKSISKFTASGQDLEKSVNALEGIANWAALSGQNATVASSAMYQLSQAMGSGIMRKEDYKSIQNLSMDTIEFRQKALDAGVALGTLQKNADGTYHSLMATGKAITGFSVNQFADHLTQDAWFTSDVMMSVYNEYAGAIDKIYRYAEAHDVTAHEAIEELGDSLDEFAVKAFKAAQEARSWADVVDSVKDAVSTGWMQTFEIIFGNYEESKTFFSQMADDFWNIFASGASARNEVLSEGLDSTWDKFSKQIKALAFDLEELSDEELAAQGYTREQANAIAELNQKIKEGAPDIKEYVQSLSERPSGRENLAQSIYNIRDALFLVDEETGKAIGFISALKAAWSEVFPPITGERIYEVTEKLREFTEKLIPSESTADRLRRTFKGLFAILDIGKQAISATVRTISPLINGLFGIADGALDVTASVGDWLVKLDEAIKEHDVFFRGLQKASDILQIVGNAISSFAHSVGQKMHLPTFGELSNELSELYETIQGRFNDGGFERIQAFIDRVKAMDSLSLKNIKKAFVDCKENVLDYFFDSGDIFNKLSGHLREFASNASNVFDDVCDSAEGAKTKATTVLGSIVQFLVNAKDKIFEVALDIRSKLAEKIGFGEIFSIGLGTAMVVFTKKIADALGVIAAPLEGIGRVFNSASKALNSFALKTKTEALKNVAEAILILVGALAVMTLLDQEKLKSAVITLGILSAGLLAFSFAMSKMGKPAEIAGMSASFLALGASLLMISSSMRKLEGLENIGKSFLVITGIMAGLFASSRLMGSKSKTFATSAASLIAFALSLKIFVGVIKDIDKMKIENVGKTATVILGAVTSLMAISAVCKNVKFSAGAGMLAMVISLKVLISSFADLAKLDAGKAKTALESFAVIFGMFAAVMVASKFAGEHASKAGSAILKMSAALALIVVAFKMMEGIDPLAIERSKKTISQLLIVFALITAASNFAGQNASKAGVMLLMMSGAILILSTAMTLLSHLDPAGLDRALDAVTQLLVVFGALVAVTRFAGEAEKAQGTLIMLTVAIAALTVSISALSLLDPERLSGAVAAISILMGVFSMMIAATHFAQKATGTLAVMTLVVAGLAGILTMMSALHTENALGNAEALSVLLLSMSGALVLLSKTGTIAPSAYAAIAVMTAIVAGLAGIFGLMDHFNVQPSIEAAASLSVLLLSMSGACLMLTAVGTAGPAAFIGVGVLATLIAAVGGIMAAICALTANNPTIEADLDRAIMVMEKIGTGLGVAIGGFVGGVIGGLSSGLPMIGDNLASFMTNAQPFFDGARNIDASAVDGIKSLAEAILIITGTNFIETIASWLTGGSSITDFANQLVPFGRGIAAFSNVVTDINPEVVTAAATAGKVLAEMAATVPNSGGIVSWFAGNNDIEDFADQLIPFGKAMVDFSNAVDGIKADAVVNAATAGEALSQMASTIPNSDGIVSWFTGNNDMEDFAAQLVPFGSAIKDFSEVVDGLSTEAVETAANAGQIMVELANTIPNTGGVLGFLAGNNDMDVFGTQLVSFGKSIKEFAIEAAGISTEAVQNAANAGQIMVELSKTLPNSGGVVSWFTGDNKLDSFGEQLVSFGESLSAYSIAVKYVKADVVSASANAAQALSTLANGLPQISVFEQWFGGSQTLSSFGSEISKFGGYISEYYSEISGADTSKLSEVITQVWSLVELADGIKKMEKNSFSNFGTALKDLANAGIDDFVATFDNSGNRVNNAVAGMLTAVGESISSHKSNATGGMRDVMTSLLDVISKKTVDIKSSVASMMTGVSDAIRSKTSAATAAMQAVIQGALNAVSGYDTKFYVVGQNVGQGFVNGIRSKLSSAYSAGWSLGKTALEASQKSVESRSPARKFIELGENVGAGFVIGIKSKMSNVSKAGSNLGLASLDAMRETLDCHSPSGETEDIGEDSGQGFINGLVSKAPDVYKAGGEVAKDAVSGIVDGASKMTGEATSAIGEILTDVLKNSGADTSNLSLDLFNSNSSKQAINQTTNALTKEASAVNTVAQSYQNATAAKEQYGLTYQETLDWIEEKKFYNQLSTKEELELYEQMQKRYLEGSEERKKIDREVYTLRNQLVNESYQNSMNWIENEQYYNRMTLSDELAAYKRVQSRYAKGTDERKKMDREVYRIEQEIYEAQKQYIADVQRVETEANEKRLELQEEYADKVRSINDKLASDIQNANDRYLNALESRTDSLYNSYGLFDEVKEREEVSGSELLDNLQGQVEEFTDWQRTINKLSARGVDSEMISELQKMGPAAISQIKALEAMSDTELNRYVSLWSVKHALARRQAIDELEGLRIETEQNIAQLRADAERDLEDYRITWQEKMNQIDIDANAELDQLRKGFAEKVGLIKKDTETETQDMVDTVQKILTEAGWDETGQAIVAGIKQGVEDEKPSFLDSITQMALDAVAAAKETLDINSPSRVFRQLGNFTGLGFVKGITDYAQKSYDAGAYVADEAKDGLSNAMQTITDYLNGDTEIRPTIRPVMDLSDIANSTETIDGLFYNQRLLSLAGQTSFAFNANAGDNNMTVNVDNASVVDELRNLRGEMAEMAERMSHLQVVLDSGTLVGETADMMDYALGQRQVYKGRRN